jgi:hypothetical protein
MDNLYEDDGRGTALGNSTCLACSNPKLNLQHGVGGSGWSTD